MASFRSVSLTLLLSLASTWLSSTVLAQSDSLAASSACGYVFDTINQDPVNNWIYYASDVYDCLTSVPILTDVALQYIDYFNSTIQYQSTLAFLRNPPAGYQPPPVDVEAVLTEIRQNVTAGNYNGEYEFEATLQKLIQATHDGHVSLDAGALSAFTFGSPYDIMSISIDGIQAPKVYIMTDVIAYLQSGAVMPSAIQYINGIDTVQYLTEFAVNQSFGFLEPHGDWNNLMYSPVQDILGTYDLFGWNALYYPGDELTFTLENQTIVDTYWLAFYFNGEYTGPLTTGGDYYNYFVLGLLPASYNPPNGTDSNDTTIDTGNTTTVNYTSWNAVSPAYPANADIYQPDLVSGGGILTGYYLRDISTAVLSIPSFNEGPDDAQTFSDTVAAFISGATAAGMTKVVIDLQGNTGGTTLLAFDTFQQFFPDIEAFGGSRRRDFGQENVLGDTITEFWSALYPGDPQFDYDYYYSGLAASEWVLTDRINAATGRNFSSWNEYYGPIAADGDFFSLVERYNLSSEIFDEAATLGFVPPYRPNKSPPWSAQNIAILTDGACASTCSIFVEMMNYQAGVRTVVIGGMPTTGPMQATSGGRGASEYTADNLDADMTFASAINDTAASLLPSNFTQSIYTYYFSFNLRDQVRLNDPVPLQFKYEAADCRIYYTFANVYNMTRLWHDAAAAMFTNSTLCVAGSTGYSTTGNSTASKQPPSGAGNMTFTGVKTGIHSKSSFPMGIGILVDKKVQTVKSSASFSSCSTQSCSCGSSDQATVNCGDDDGGDFTVCKFDCTNVGGPCGNNQGLCIKISGLQPELKAQTTFGLKPSGTGTVPSQSPKVQGTCSPIASQLPICNTASIPLPYPTARSNNGRPY